MGCGCLEKEGFSIGNILLDMKRTSSPNQYDSLLDEWVQHPEVVATQAEYDAIDALMDEQGQPNAI